MAVATDELDVNIALLTVANCVPPKYGLATAAEKYLNVIPYVTPKSVILLVDMVKVLPAQTGDGKILILGIVGHASHPPGPINVIVSTDPQLVVTLVIVTIKDPTPKPLMSCVVAPVLQI